MLSCHGVVVKNLSGRIFVKERDLKRDLRLLSQAANKSEGEKRDDEAGASLSAARKMN